MYEQSFKNPKKGKRIGIIFTQKRMMQEYLKRSMIKYMKEYYQKIYVLYNNEEWTKWIEEYESNEKGKSKITFELYNDKNELNNLYKIKKMKYLMILIDFKDYFQEFYQSLNSIKLIFLIFNDGNIEEVNNGLPNSVNKNKIIISGNRRILKYFEKKIEYESLFHLSFLNKLYEKKYIYESNIKFKILFELNYFDDYYLNNYFKNFIIFLNSLLTSNNGI
jgi:hypothetical protein